MGLLVVPKMSLRGKRSSAAFMSTNERFGTGRHMDRSYMFSEKMMFVESSITLVTL